MNLIYEIERTTLDMLLEVSKKVDGEIAFRAPAMLLDQFTKNGRRYSTAVMEKALARITDGQGRTMFGSAGHVEKFEVPDVSHRIDRLWIDKKIGALMVEGAILPTTRGKDLAIVVKAGKLGLSLKGTGTLKAVEEGKGEDVQDDYKLNGIDFTLNPACDMATVSKANLYESVDFPEISDDKRELAAKIEEAVKAGLAKVEKKLRPLVEVELKNSDIEAVELVEDKIKEAETKVRYTINEAVRCKIVEKVEVKPELGIVINYDEMTTNEKRNKAIVQEARAAGSKLSVEEILKPLNK